MMLQKLPLELVQAILAQAMLVRGVRRALRLRLVNKLFASEVVKMLCELRMLDDFDVQVSATGAIGAAYLSHLLLSKTTTLGPRLANMRRIASRLASEDGKTDDADVYASYIDKLSRLIVSGCWRSMPSMFGPDNYAQQPSILDYDLLAAAVFTGNSTIVDELSAQETLLRLNTATIPNPYAAAAMTGNTVLIDLLLERTAHHEKGAGLMWCSMLRVASREGSRSTVEYLLTSKFKPDLGFNKEGPLRSLYEALITPDVGIFETLMRYKEKALTEQCENFMPIKARPFAMKRLPELLQPLDEQQLAALLSEAAEAGWDKMTAYLLDMGAPTEGYVYAQGRDDGLPLLAACGSGSKNTVEVLLQHNARITGLEIERAAMKGHLGVVKTLLEHGVDCNIGNTPPLVSAIKLEYTDMFKLLMEHGAQLERTGRIAAEAARKEELGSMLALLEQYGAHIH